MSVNYFSPRNRIFFSRLVGVLFFCAFTVSISGWREIVPMLSGVLSWVGWALITLGVIGRLWCSSHIGGKKNATLVAAGPYSVCRNPLYFFSFLGGMGGMFLTHTFLFPCLFATLFISYYAKVIASEEDVLLAIHSADYRNYYAKVPRFWPKISLLSEPIAKTVSTTHFFKSFTEMIWFFVAGGLIMWLENLHLSGHLPTLFSIY